MKTLTILGATGSVGQQTLDIVRRHSGVLKIHTLMARHGSEKLAQLCMEFQPKFAVVANAAEVSRLHARLKDVNSSTELFADDGRTNLAHVYQADVTVTAIAGAAGLIPTLKAIEAGNTVLITNKEPVVMLGSLLRDQVKKHSATIVPVDSEHNAIFQCCCATATTQYECFSPIDGLRRILLTGSGGPFRSLKQSALKDVTPAQAVAHPVWNMGPKISIDSATMMNKGLEIIEARWLFDTPPAQIDVVIHPQGIVHSMVEYLDGSLLAQMATPDMRVPLAFGIFWPHRTSSGAERLNIFELSVMSFEPPDYERFPSLQLAREVAECKGTAATVMNAANEVAVAAFLASKIRFTEISTIIAHCVERLGNEACDSIDVIMEVDRSARETAAQKIKCLTGNFSVAKNL